MSPLSLAVLVLVLILSNFSLGQSILRTHHRSQAFVFAMLPGLVSPGWSSAQTHCLTLLCLEQDHGWTQWFWFRPWIHTLQISSVDSPFCTPRTDGGDIGKVQPISGNVTENNIMVTALVLQVFTSIIVMAFCVYLNIQSSMSLGGICVSLLWIRVIQVSLHTDECRYEAFSM